MYYYLRACFRFDQLFCLIVLIDYVHPVAYRKTANINLNISIDNCHITLVVECRLRHNKLSVHLAQRWAPETLSLGSRMIALTILDNIQQFVLRRILVVCVSVDRASITLVRLGIVLAGSLNLIGVSLTVDGVGVGRVVFVWRTIKKHDGQIINHQVFFILKATDMPICLL